MEDPVSLELKANLVTSAIPASMVLQAHLVR